MASVHPEAIGSLDEKRSRSPLLPRLSFYVLGQLLGPAAVLTLLMTAATPPLPRLVTPEAVALVFFFMNVPRV